MKYGFVCLSLHHTAKCNHVCTGGSQPQHCCFLQSITLHMHCPRPRSRCLLTPLSQSIHCKSLPQAAVCTNTTPPALPCSSKAQEAAACTGAGLQRDQEGGGDRKRGVRLNGEARDGGHGGRGGFFGKGANPITGSGAALVSLAALNSHFNSLPPAYLLPPSPITALPLPGTVSYFFSSWLTLIAPNSAPLRSTSVCLLVGLKRWRNGTVSAAKLHILSPYSCVMLRSEGRLQRPAPSPCVTQLCRSYQPSAEELQPGLIRSHYRSALPATPEGVNG